MKQDPKLHSTLRKHYMPHLKPTQPIFQSWFGVGLGKGGTEVWQQISWHN